MQPGEIKTKAEALAKKLGDHSPAELATLMLGAMLKLAEYLENMERKRTIDK